MLADPPLEGFAVMFDPVLMLALFGGQLGRDLKISGNGNPFEAG